MAAIVRDLWSFAKKAGRKSFVEYVFYPALAGPLAAKVLAGNALADAVRNGWAYMVIYCGHLTEHMATFREEDLAGEDRAHWYARQVMGSGNFEIGGLGHVLSGHLGYQIEHHYTRTDAPLDTPRTDPVTRRIHGDAELFRHEAAARADVRVARHTVAARQRRHRLGMGENRGRGGAGHGRRCEPPAPRPSGP